EREDDGHRRPSPGLAREANRPLVRLDDLPGEGQPETEAARLPAREQVESVREGLRVHPAAGVLERHDHARAGLDRRSDADARRSGRPVASLDRVLEEVREGVGEEAAVRAENDLAEGGLELELFSTVRSD